MTIVKAAAVPAEILALIQDPPLLKGESLREYFSLFSALVSDVAPTDIVEWLWLVQFSDCTWEIFRNRRFRALIVDLQRGAAYGALILKASPSGTMHPAEYNRRVARCKENPDYLSEFGIDPGVVPATALVQVAVKLELIDKGLERLYRRCDSILHQLEYRREVFAHRARCAANRILKEEIVEAPKIVPDAAPLAIEPPDPARNDQDPTASNELVTAQRSSESSEIPDSGETSPEVSNITPSSDLQHEGHTNVITEPNSGE